MNSMILLQLLPDVTGNRHFRMAAAKPEVLISQLLDKMATPFQRLTPIFGIQQLNNATANTVRCNRKSVFKDGGRQTGSTYISASRQDGNSVSTANPMFSGYRNQIGPLGILSDQNGSGKSKMAAAQSEVLISRHDRNSISTATPMFWRSDLAVPQSNGAKEITIRPNRK